MTSTRHHCSRWADVLCAYDWHKLYTLIAGQISMHTDTMTPTHLTGTSILQVCAYRHTHTHLRTYMHDNPDVSPGNLDNLARQLPTPRQQVSSILTRRSTSITFMIILIPKLILLSINRNSVFIHWFLVARLHWLLLSRCWRYWLHLSLLQEQWQPITGTNVVCTHITHIMVYTHITMQVLVHLDKSLAKYVCPHADGHIRGLSSGVM